MSRATVVLLSSLLLVLVACERRGSPFVEPTPTFCPHAQFAPTYIPWAKNVPKPDKIQVRGDAITEWLSPPRKGVTDRVSIVRYDKPEPRFAEGKPVSVRGHEGRLDWVGSPAVEVTIQWTETDGACGSYGLFLFDQSLSEREAEAEIKKIAESLR